MPGAGVAFSPTGPSSGVALTPFFVETVPPTETDPEALSWFFVMNFPNALRALPAF